MGNPLHGAASAPQALRERVSGAEPGGPQSAPPGTPRSKAATTQGAFESLALVARLHRVAADPAALLHQLGKSPSEPLATADLLMAAKHLGLKVKATPTTPERLPLVPLPAIARLHDGRYVVLAQCDGQRVLVQDVGFVREAQAAEVKLETFAFTRYGTVAAQVQTIAAGAVHEDKRGAIFPATLVLQQDSLQVDGKRIRLSSGMNLTAEIKTGKRRVVEFLLSPVQQTVNESMKER